MYSPLDKFLDIVVFNERISVYWTLIARISCLGSTISSQTKNLLQVLHTLKYILLKVLLMEKKIDHYGKKSEFWDLQLVQKSLVSFAFQFVLAAIFCQITQKNYDNIRIRLKNSHSLISTKDANGYSQVKSFGHLLKIAHMVVRWIWTLHCTCPLWIKWKKI